jgi:hypothetical protein
MSLGNLDIDPIPIRFPAKPDIDGRKRRLLLLTFSRDPMNLISLHLVRCCGLDQMICECDEVVLLPLSVQGLGL